MVWFGLVCFVLSFCVLFGSVLFCFCCFFFDMFLFSKVSQYEKTKSSDTSKVKNAEETYQWTNIIIIYIYDYNISRSILTPQNWLL